MQYFIQKDESNIMTAFVECEEKQEGYIEISEELALKIKENQNSIIKIIDNDIEVVETFEVLKYEAEKETTLSDIFDLVQKKETTDVLYQLEMENTIADIKDQLEILKEQMINKGE